LLVLILALPASGQTGAYPDPPAFTVGVFGGNFASGGPTLDLTVDLTGQTSRPGRISLYAPNHFQLWPNRDPGSPVGKAFLFARNPPSAATAFTVYSGPISAELIDAAAEVAAQACSLGSHTAIWLLHLKHKTRTLDIPVYLAPTGSGDPPGTMLKLELCPPIASGAKPDPSAAFASLVLSLADLEPPATPGTYQWRAIVSPLQADDATLNAAAAYELRARFLVPHVLTLRGRYLPAAHQARLTGTLRARGHPQPRAIVELVELNRTITAHGPLFHDTTSAFTETRRDGTYAITVPLQATRGFVAGSPPTLTACTGPSVAPTGCRSTTTAGIQSDPVTVSVP
jgi:hypothetical protein